MFRYTALAVAVAVVVAIPAGAGEVPPASFDDGAFLTSAACGGRCDARLSDLIGSQTRNAEVRKFAARIVAERMMRSTDLEVAAKDVGVKLPTELDDTHLKLYASFKEYKGTDLEGDFVKAMARRLTVGVALFTRASRDANSPAVRAFATNMLPILQKQLEAAKSLDK